MRRLVLTALALAALALPTWTAPASAQKFKISYAGVNANFAQYFVAEDKGYFKDEGLDVELVQLAGGVATPALISGDLAYSGSPSSAMSAIMRGAPLKVILIGQSKPIYELWSFDPAVHKLEDLQGKIVALTIRGGTDELAMRMILNKRGLPPNYVAITPAGSEANVVAALLSGAIQSGIVTRTEKGMLKTANALEKGRMLVDFHNEIRMQTGGLVTTTQEIAEHRDRVQKVLRAVWKGTLYLMSQKDGVTDVMRKREPNLAPDIIDADVAGGMQDVEETGMMPMDAAAGELLARAEISGVPAAQVPPADKVYDFGPIKEAIAQIKQSGWKPQR
jgi:NitT/TauT family transport system substrate-binding protein